MDVTLVLTNQRGSGRPPVVRVEPQSYLSGALMTTGQGASIHLLPALGAPADPAQGPRPPGSQPLSPPQLVQFLATSSPSSVVLLRSSSLLTPEADCCMSGQLFAPGDRTSSFAAAVSPGSRRPPEPGFLPSGNNEQRPISHKLARRAAPAGDFPGAAAASKAAHLLPGGTIGHAGDSPGYETPPPAASHREPGLRTPSKGKACLLH